MTRSVRVVDNLKIILAPGAQRAPHDTAARLRREYLGYEGQFFGTQQVEEYQEETRSHLLALCASTRGADVRPQRGRRDTFATLSAGVEQERAAGPKGAAAPTARKLDESVIEEEYARLAG